MIQVAIVDDNPDLLELLATILEEDGFEVDQFQTGATFINQLNHKTYSLAVLDVNLPDINGNEIVEVLDERNLRSRLKVVLASSRADLSDLAYQCQADAYVAKPFDTEELVAQVNQLSS